MNLFSQESGNALAPSSNTLTQNTGHPFSDTFLWVTNQICSVPLGSKTLWMLEVDAERDSAEDQAEAQYELGMRYWEGRGGVKKDLEQAVAWFKKSAGLGCVEAQYRLAGAYLKGIGVTRNYKNALGLFKKAAEQGLAEAQFKIGKLYWEDKEQDKAIAYGWLKKAVDQGYEKAQDRLKELSEELRSIVYKLWEEVKSPNPTISQVSLEELKKFALQGYDCAQYGMGLYYQSINKDKEADEWFAKAAAQGHQGAAEVLELKKESFFYSHRHILLSLLILFIISLVVFKDKLKKSNDKTSVIGNLYQQLGLLIQNINLKSNLNVDIDKETKEIFRINELGDIEKKFNEIYLDTIKVKKGNDLDKNDKEYDKIIIRCHELMKEINNEKEGVWENLFSGSQALKSNFQKIFFEENNELPESFDSVKRALEEKINKFISAVNKKDSEKFQPILDVYFNLKKEMSAVKEEIKKENEQKEIKTNKEKAWNDLNENIKNLSCRIEVILSAAKANSLFDKLDQVVVLKTEISDLEAEITKLLNVKERDDNVFKSLQTGYSNLEKRMNALRDELNNAVKQEEKKCDENDCSSWLKKIESLRFDLDQASLNIKKNNLSRNFDFSISELRKKIDYCFNMKKQDANTLARLETTYSSLSKEVVRLNKDIDIAVREEETKNDNKKKMENDKAVEEEQKRKNHQEQRNFEKLIAQSEQKLSKDKSKKVKLRSPLKATYDEIVSMGSFVIDSNNQDDIELKHLALSYLFFNLALLALASKWNCKEDWQYARTAMIHRGIMVPEQRGCFNELTGTLVKYKEKSKQKIVFAWILNTATEETEEIVKNFFQGNHFAKMLADTFKGYHNNLTTIDISSKDADSLVTNAISTFVKYARSYLEDNDVSGRKQLQFYAMKILLTWCAEVANFVSPNTPQSNFARNCQDIRNKIAHEYKGFEMDQNTLQTLYNQAKKIIDSSDSKKTTTSFSSFSSGSSTSSSSSSSSSNSSLTFFSAPLSSSSSTSSQSSSSIGNSSSSNVSNSLPRSTFT